MDLLEAYKGHIVKVEFDHRATETRPYIARLKDLDQSFALLSPCYPHDKRINATSSSFDDIAVNNVLDYELLNRVIGVGSKPQLTVARAAIATIESVLDTSHLTFYGPKSVREHAKEDFTHANSDLRAYQALRHTLKSHQWYAFQKGKRIESIESPHLVAPILKLLNETGPEKTTFIYHQP